LKFFAWNAGSLILEGVERLAQRDPPSRMPGGQLAFGFQLHDEGGTDAEAALYTDTAPH